MSAQTTYNYCNGWGAAGGIVDLAPYEIDTYLNGENTGVMKFGRAAVDGTTAGTDIKLPTATTNVFEGVTVNNRTTELTMEGELTIKNKAAIGVMRYGRVYVALATGADPAFGEAVYVVCAGDEKGCFTDVATNNMPINARFVSVAKNGVAMIELQQNNVINAALAPASATAAGVVKIGNGITVTTDGTISVG